MGGRGREAGEGGRGCRVWDVVYDLETFSFLINNTHFHHLLESVRVHVCLSAWVLTCVELHVRVINRRAGYLFICVVSLLYKHHYTYEHNQPQNSRRKDNKLERKSSNNSYKATHSVKWCMESIPMQKMIFSSTAGGNGVGGGREGVKMRCTSLMISELLLLSVCTHFLPSHWVRVCCFLWFLF